jgi:hypothetical protein
VDLHNGSQVAKTIGTNMTFVTKDNVDQFLQPAAGATPTATK